MIYSKSAVELIRNVVNSMTFPVIIKSVAPIVIDGEDFQKVIVCDIYHAEPGRYVTIDSVEYLIQEINNGSIDSCGERVFPYLILKGIPDITATTFDLYGVYFYHGTAIATNIELGKIPADDDAKLKTPMIWLAEIYEENEFDILDQRDKEISGDGIFFLTQANHEDWLTDEAYQKAVEPMQRLCDNFIAKLRSMPDIFYMEEFRKRTKNYAKFGVYASEKGILLNEFNNKLGGVRLQSTITTVKQFVCDDCHTNTNSVSISV